MLFINDSGERPFFNKGPSVGKHAATTEQHGSMRDQMRIFATVAGKVLVEQHD